MKTLQDYFARCMRKPIGDGFAIDHAIRVKHRDAVLDRVCVYIHPASVSGDTIDFCVIGNECRPCDGACGLVISSASDNG